MINPLAQELTQHVLPLIPEWVRAEIRQMPQHERSRITELGLELVEEGLGNYGLIAERCQDEVNDIEFEKIVKKHGDPARLRCPAGEPMNYF